MDGHLLRCYASASYPNSSWLYCVVQLRCHSVTMAITISAYISEYLGASSLNPLGVNLFRSLLPLDIVKVDLCLHLCLAHIPLDFRLAHILLNVYTFDIYLPRLDLRNWTLHLTPLSPQGNDSG